MIGAYIVQPLFLVLPRAVVLQLAKFFGRCGFYLLKKERNKALSNLAYAFGDSEDEQSRKRLVKRIFVNFALMACDFALFPKLSPQKINDLVTISGIEKIGDVVKKRKQGFIILTAHLGNWELIAPVIISRGYYGSVLGKEIYYTGYNKLIIRLRESQGVYTFYRDRSPKEMLQRLKRGEGIGILPDQDIADVDGIFVDFFHKPAYTPTGPAKLARAARVPIILTFMIREGNRYRLQFDDIIEPFLYEKEDKKAAIERMTRAWSNVVERYIRMYPDQWVWTHNRWKTKQSKT